MPRSDEEGHKLGVFEFMQRGSLRDLLDKRELSWADRMGIAVGGSGAGGPSRGEAGVGSAVGGEWFVEVHSRGGLIGKKRRPNALGQSAVSSCAHSGVALVVAARLCCHGVVPTRRAACPHAAIEEPS